MDRTIIIKVPFPILIFVLALIPNILPPWPSITSFLRTNKFFIPPWSTRNNDSEMSVFPTHFHVAHHQTWRYSDFFCWCCTWELGNSIRFASCHYTTLFCGYCFFADHVNVEISWTKWNFQHYVTLCTLLTLTVSSTRRSSKAWKVC